MSDNIKKQEMYYWVERLGVSLTPTRSELDMLYLNQLKIIDLMPEMLVMVRSVVAKETFSIRRKPITAFENGISISFQNIINSPSKIAVKDKQVLQQTQPHVRIIPLHVESDVSFPKDINIQQVTIIVSLDYLKNFIGKDHIKFDYLFNNEKTLWIEEFMSPEIAEVANDISITKIPDTLSDAYYKLKSLELLFYLFKNLSRRTNVTHQHLSKYELESVYNVRDKIAASIDKPFIQEELVKLSGMNVIKLRKLFTQVFGKGMYPYYQHVRMQEAARLLREEHLSVSEVGYQLGFSNLSYFGRLFERHLGCKPKKWTQNNMNRYKNSDTNKEYSQIQ
ncbi:helix-turn-helix transcriptional regulator [Sphingobacterium sp. DN00404]|uniref:Helix-turn-helix transcriptional regulator n=1 Tax=Sphingobacterium micropteri TaxID=2763501 RepID=A0ABR7YRB1_9SPHI|nr:helix-turn-helix domain-containing protein [Sphingobacterium micropteri]MBD1433746.1 helix-turn-helix transcriptional regulator [Sphingobacterium micropteri]